MEASPTTPDNDKKGDSWAVLTIGNSTLSGNSASYGGGGVFNTSGRWTGAVLTINNRTFSGNSAGYSGGGIDNNGYEIVGATATLNNSMISGNSSAVQVVVFTTARPLVAMEVWKSTTARWPPNSATYGGGGVFNVSYSLSQAMLQINNGTISGGSAQTGGGIDNESDDGGAIAYISNGTFSGNSASDSGGGSVFNFDASVGGGRGGMSMIQDSPGRRDGRKHSKPGRCCHVRTATTSAMKTVAAC